MTSVPSDAPDDYIALREIQTNEKLIAKYGINPDWTKFDPVPIIDIPGYSNMSAIKAHEEHPNDAQKAKEVAYSKGTCA